MKLWQNFLPIEVAHAVVNSQISLESLQVKHNIHCEKKLKSVFVLDNADRMSEDLQKNLCEHIRFLKNQNVLDNIAIIVIRCGKPVTGNSVYDKIICVPNWTENEIDNLLSIRFPQNKDLRERIFIKLLTVKSAGHPVLAEAIAKKNPNGIVDLLLNAGKPGPDLDGKLGKNIEEQLTEFLLSDIDAKKLAVRMTNALFGADFDQIEVLCKLDPPVSRTAGDLLAELTGTVFEKDVNEKFTVAPVFRDVLSTLQNEREKQSTFDALSNCLLQANDRVLQVPELIYGIYYATYAKKYEKAFMWCTLLIGNSIKSTELGKEGIKSIVEKLFPLAYIQLPSNNEELLFKHRLMVFGTATLACKADMNEIANQLYQKIISTPFVNVSDSMASTEAWLMFASQTFMVMHPMNAKDNAAAISSIEKIDWNNLAVLDTLCFLMAVSNVKLLLTFIKNLEKYIDILNSLLINPHSEAKNLLSVIIHCSLHIGAELNLKSGKSLLDTIISGIPKNHLYRDLVVTLIRAQYYADSGMVSEAIELSNKAQTIVEDFSCEEKEPIAAIAQLQADCLYKAESYEKAKLYYHQASDITPVDVQTEFIYSWSKYREGLCEEDNAKAVILFQKASEHFTYIGYKNQVACCKGEEAVCLALSGDIKGFALIMEFALKSYFIDGNKIWAPYTAIMIAHARHLVVDVINNGCTLKANDSFNRGHYKDVSDNLMPEINGHLAFLRLLQIFCHTGNDENIIRLINLSWTLDSTQLQDEKNLLVHCAFAAGSAVQKNEIELLGKITSLTINKRHERSISKRDSADAIFTWIIELNRNGEYQRVIDVLAQLRETIIHLDKEERNWWIAEIDWRIANATDCDINIENSIKVSRWIQSYSSAENTENWMALYNSGGQKGFSYMLNKIYNPNSMRELAKIQFKTLKAAEKLPDNTILISSIGASLYHIWSNLNWRKLYASDIPIKKALLELAEKMQSENIITDVASQKMIGALRSLDGVL